MLPTRRSAVSALGLALPFWPLGRATAAAPAPLLGFRSFEEAVRAAFADPVERRETTPCRRVEVGASELLHAGIQGCHNDRPFAGFPAGHLRIVRIHSEPGLMIGGVRLFVTMVDVLWTGERDPEGSSRLLDFALLPPAPILGSSVSSEGF